MIGAAVARRYAKALMELGHESGTLDALVAEIGAIGDAVSQNAELRSLLHNPEVSRAARKSILIEIAQRLGAGTIARNTVAFLADSGRLDILPAIAQALREQAARRAGILRASVTSAIALDDAFVSRLTQALERRFKQRVVVSRTVDPTLLAGVVTRVGDTVIDGSLRARLRDLRVALLPQ